MGNPGSRYEDTRHNLGFRVLDAMAARHGRVWSRSASTYHRADIDVSHAAIALIKPQRYVNRSGAAIFELRRVEEFSPAEVFVVADDIALPVGQLRLRRKGTDGGHNGLKSLIDVLGTSAFPRLRLGVGPVPTGEDAADFVLDPFDRDERPAVEQAVERAVDCLEDVVRQGFDRAMGVYNAPSANGEGD